MKKRSGAAYVVVVFLVVLLALGVPACSEEEESISPYSTPQETGAAQKTTPATNAPLTTSLAIDGGSLEVVYFHRANRCHSCIWAEEATTKTLKTHFSEELANGGIVYQIVNLQDESNADLVAKYKAHSSSLFVNTIQNNTDHIQEITGIWTKLNRDEAFTRLVKTTIEEQLGNI